MCLLDLNTILKFVNVGTSQREAVLASSPGSISLLLILDLNRGLALLLLPSRTRRFVSFFTQCVHTPSINFLKINSNIHNNRRLKYKGASFSFYKGFRPKVRGVAKNPTDHPHGGRTKSIRFPRTPWGFPTKRK